MKLRKHIAAVSFKRGKEERNRKMKDSHTHEVCVEKSVHLKQGSPITCQDIVG